MKCAAWDSEPGLGAGALEDFYFEALGAEDARRVREHVSGCGECSGELERLRLATLALRALPEEEIPRRIAFVSDKVFAPSPVARFWTSFWLSGARMASAAALVLAGAIVFHAVRQPVPQGVAPIARSVDFRPEMQAAVDRAVAKAVAETEARYDLKLKKVIDANDAEKRATMTRVEELLETMDRQNKIMTVASNRTFEAGQ